MPSSNPFQDQWSPTPVAHVPGKPGSIAADLTQLNGTVHAVRLAWVLFDAPYQVGDTCCPSSAVQSGRGACIPGSCPLYTAESELPANPFFATITPAGKCACPAPQTCDE